MALSLVPLEELKSIENAEGLPEGAKDRIEVNRYERSPANRAACISNYGPICQGCGFDFEKMYGPIAAGFIEVHHVVPVSQLGEGYLVNPVKDLVPLCANCHAVVHRTDPPLSIEELKSLVDARQQF
jgi:5-methylcytosine-specific restriction protein A